MNIKFLVELCSCNEALQPGGFGEEPSQEKSEALELCVKGEEP